MATSADSRGKWPDFSVASMARLPALKRITPLRKRSTIAGGRARRQIVITSSLDFDQDEFRLSKESVEGFGRSRRLVGPGVEIGHLVRYVSHVVGHRPGTGS